ncbi:MAG: CoA-binding protein [Desulfurococcales archaeon ex4484_58]|nr:MAG: CoA-binding protein [Desulfurococcales archaeon ex4484_58]
MLDKFFNPRSVAIIGATPKEGKVGRVLVENFIRRFKGKIYPVNPGYDEILGLKCYRSVKEIPDEVDLAVIAIPAPKVPQVMHEIGEKGIKAVIIISGGFRETGTEEGARLEDEVKKISKEYGIRVIGPNCIGIYDNWSGVDTYFLPDNKMMRPPRGYISFISQSGAFASALLDWMAYHKIGVSRAISYGNKIDVDDIDLLEFLGEDDKTKVIFMYLEGLKKGRGRLFIKKAREIARKKPIVIYKAGKTERGGLAAASHTAALAGNYQLYVAAIRQAGLIEAKSFDEIMDLSKVLLTQPLMKGRKVYVVTDAGGVGVMLTDALASEGFILPRTPPDLKEELRKHLPPHCIVENPIDLTGDTDDERYILVLEKLLPREDVDATVVVALPQVPGIKGKVAEYLIEAKEKYKKPLISVLIGSVEAEKFKNVLENNGIPVFESPERAAKALAALYRYSKFRGVAKD